MENASSRNMYKSHLESSSGHASGHLNVLRSRKVIDNIVRVWWQLKSRIFISCEIIVLTRWIFFVKLEENSEFSLYCVTCDGSGRNSCSLMPAFEARSRIHPCAHRVLASFHFHRTIYCIEEGHVLGDVCSDFLDESLNHEKMFDLFILNDWLSIGSMIFQASFLTSWSSSTGSSVSACTWPPCRMNWNWIGFNEVFSMISSLMGKFNLPYRFPWSVNTNRVVAKRRHKWVPWPRPERRPIPWTEKNAHPTRRRCEGSTC